jgi:hypothetical protein
VRLLEDERSGGGRSTGQDRPRGDRRRRRLERRAVRRAAGGEIVGNLQLPGGAPAPVVAGSTLYFLTDNAKLIAFR